LSARSGHLGNAFPIIQKTNGKRHLACASASGAFQKSSE